MDSQLALAFVVGLLGLLLFLRVGIGPARELVLQKLHSRARRTRARRCMHRIACTHTCLKCISC